MPTIPRAIQLLILVYVLLSCLLYFTTFLPPTSNHRPPQGIQQEHYRHRNEEQPQRLTLGRDDDSQKNREQTQAEYLPATECYKNHKGVISYRNAIINPLRASRIIGKERDEFYRLTPGFVTLFCSDEPAAKQVLKTRKGTETNVMITHVYPRNHIIKEYENLVLATREEYANIYWQIMDVFDIFQALNDRGISGNNTSVLWIDDHPNSSVDPLWSLYFKSVHRIASYQFPGKLFARNLIIRPPRSRSLLMQQDRGIMKQIDEFRDQINPTLSTNKKVDCEQVNVLIIWRRDYVNHPGNPLGVISRKVSNEDDVVDEMRKFPNIRLTEAQLDRLPLELQLRYLSQADVVFGMHGAGHALAMFMRKGGVVVEVFPDSTSNWHMGHIATQSGHRHITHSLKDSDKDKTSFFIPRETTNSLINKALHHLCPKI